MQVLLHTDAHEEGGLAFTNKELLDQQRGAVMELVKEVRPFSEHFATGQGSYQQRSAEDLSNSSSTAKHWQDHWQPSSLTVKHSELLLNPSIYSACLGVLGCRWGASYCLAT